MIDKLEKQVERYKKARLARKRTASAPELASEAPAESPGEEEEHRVVKVKRFPLKPMTVEEAVLQMNLLGHDFFVFHNGDTMQINVVYQRRDGDYGLLEPDR